MTEEGQLRVKEEFVRAESTGLPGEGDRSETPDTALRESCLGGARRVTAAPRRERGGGGQPMHVHSFHSPQGLSCQSSSKWTKIPVGTEA